MTVLVTTTVLLPPDDVRLVVTVRVVFVIILSNLPPLPLLVCDDLLPEPIISIFMSRRMSSGMKSSTDPTRRPENTPCASREILPPSLCLCLDSLPPDDRRFTTPDSDTSPCLPVDMSWRLPVAEGETEEEEEEEKEEKFWELFCSLLPPPTSSTCPLCSEGSDMEGRRLATPSRTSTLAPDDSSPASAREDDSEFWEETLSPMLDKSVTLEEYPNLSM